MLSKAVSDRVSLEKGARKILGPEVKLDGKTDREVKVAVLVKTDEKFDADGRSDEYVDGRFDHVVAAAPDRNHSREKVAGVIVGGRKPRADADNETPIDDESRIDSAESAKARSRRQAAELGRKNLRVSVG